MTFHIFFFTVALQKKVLSEDEIIRKQQLKQTTDKLTDIRSTYYTQMC
ncbi:YrzI family small protein [Bacillus cereus]|uniref:YrzI family protein n=1 Tax=Bacillus cereus TaxID=1396 RepID=A0A2A8R2U2_BACCE|nr:YrzI family small protein [Bacillus cereus]PEX80086.1 YrzI family protein [Bacillus cereus]PFN19787.1 YrzI family protein [Bacillus cereus]